MKLVFLYKIIAYDQFVNQSDYIPFETPDLISTLLKTSTTKEVRGELEKPGFWPTFFRESGEICLSCLLENDKIQNTPKSDFVKQFLQKAPDLETYVSWVKIIASKSKDLFALCTVNLSEDLKQFLERPDCTSRNPNAQKEVVSYCKRIEKELGALLDLHTKNGFKLFPFKLFVENAFSYDFLVKIFNATQNAEGFDRASIGKLLNKFLPIPNAGDEIVRIVEGLARNEFPPIILDASWINQAVKHVCTWEQLQQLLNAGQNLSTWNDENCEMLSASIGSALNSLATTSNSGNEAIKIIEALSNRDVCIRKTIIRLNFKHIAQAVKHVQTLEQLLRVTELSRKFYLKEEAFNHFTAAIGVALNVLPSTSESGEELLKIIHALAEDKLRVGRGDRPVKLMASHINQAVKHVETLNQLQKLIYFGKRCVWSDLDKNMLVASIGIALNSLKSGDEVMNIVEAFDKDEVCVGETPIHLDLIGIVQAAKHVRSLEQLSRLTELGRFFLFNSDDLKLFSFAIGAALNSLPPTSNSSDEAIKIIEALSKRDVRIRETEIDLDFQHITQAVKHVHTLEQLMSMTRFSSQIVLREEGSFRYFSAAIGVALNVLPPTLESGEEAVKMIRCLSEGGVCVGSLLEPIDLNTRHITQAIKHVCTLAQLKEILSYADTRCLWLDDEPVRPLITAIGEAINVLPRTIDSGEEAIKIVEALYRGHVSVGRECIAIDIEHVMQAAKHVRTLEQFQRLTELLRKFDLKKQDPEIFLSSISVAINALQEPNFKDVTDILFALRQWYIDSEIPFDTAYVIIHSFKHISTAEHASILLDSLRSISLTENDRYMLATAFKDIPTDKIHFRTRFWLFDQLSRRECNPDILICGLVKHCKGATREQLIKIQALLYQHRSDKVLTLLLNLIEEEGILDDSPLAMRKTEERTIANVLMDIFKGSDYFRAFINAVTARLVTIQKSDEADKYVAYAYPDVDFTFASRRAELDFHGTNRSHASRYLILWINQELSNERNGRCTIITGIGLHSKHPMFDLKNALIASIQYIIKENKDRVSVDPCEGKGWFVISFLPKKRRCD